MTALLARVVGLFYAGPAPARPVAQPRRAVASSVAVLANERDAIAAGAAVGLAVARARGAAAAVVCLWTGGGEPGRHPQVPAAGAAHRLAGTLTRRGHRAVASCRLVFVRLGPDEDSAAGEAARVVAACGDVPVVLAIGGARRARLDAVIGGCDLAVVATRAGADPALSALAVAGAEALGVPVVACAVPAAPLARLLASGGARLPRTLSGAMRPAVEALR